MVQTYGEFEAGQNTDIDQVAEALTSSTFQCQFGIYIKAKLANTGNVYIGHDNTVTSSTGHELDAGEEVFIPFSKGINNIFVIADADNQGVTYLAI
jgi:hypothetical protein